MDDNLTDARIDLTDARIDLTDARIDLTDARIDLTDARIDLTEAGRGHPGGGGRFAAPDRVTGLQGRNDGG